MATYRVLYWQEIPSQIRAGDGDEEINVALDRRFQDHIDDVASARGMQYADLYLAQWKWSDERERDGTAREVAEVVKRELEATADW